MNLTEYQHAVRQTDQRPGTDLQDIVVHLLGLTGEAGSVAEVYKKKLRDAEAYGSWKLQLREELGDVLWYVAILATKLDLDLDDIAAANLEKTRSRWLLGDADQLDTDFPPHEQLPRHGTYEFVPGEDAEGRPQVTVYLDGQQVGDPLTDNTAAQDGYRFHDVFHLAYATVLGWSPVTRALLKRKRKSKPTVDEAEDGGRAIVIEETVAHLAFTYGSLHSHLDGVSRLDQALLDTITMITGGHEVGTRTAADWELAILEGHRMFRELLRCNGGAVEFDADQRSLEYRPPADR